VHVESVPPEAVREMLEVAAVTTLFVASSYSRTGCTAKGEPEFSATGDFENKS
jgi:hypothetical protein